MIGARTIPLQYVIRYNSNPEYTLPPLDRTVHDRKSGDFYITPNKVVLSNLTSQWVIYDTVVCKECEISVTKSFHKSQICVKQH